MTDSIGNTLTQRYYYTTDFIKDKEKLTHLPLAPPTNISLYLYGRAKQFEIGDCNIEQPSIFNVTARFKWNAWNSVQGLAKWEALKEYFNALRDYILTIDFSILNNEGKLLAHNMLDACSLNDIELSFIHNGGVELSLPNNQNDSVNDLKITGPDIIASSSLTSSSSSSSSSAAAASSQSSTSQSSLSTPLVPSQYSSSLSPIIPIQSTLDPNQHESNEQQQQQQQQLQQQHQEQELPNVDQIAPTTPTKSSLSTSPSFLQFDSTLSTPQQTTTTPPQQPSLTSPFTTSSQGSTIRVGSRSARKSISSKPYHHQTPIQQRPSSQYLFQQSQSHPQEESFQQLSASFTTIPPTTATTNTTLSTTTVSTTPNTKEIFLQLQQVATQTQNKQLLLLLALIDQRESSSFLKIQTLKQQQQQHLDFIDSLQQQLNTQFHSQETLINSFNTLHHELTILKQQQSQTTQTISPIVQTIQSVQDKVATVETKLESFISNIGDQISKFVSFLNDKCPTGWRWFRKKCIQWLKWILRFYSMYATVVAVIDIYKWATTSRFIYKRVTLPFNQYWFK